ncbi:unnamed protein product [Closterium sp. NIES-53]
MEAYRRAAGVPEVTCVGGTQAKNSVLILRSDRGGEFLGKEFTNFVHDLTCPYTPQQNGMAEREMRTVVESVRTMLLHMGVQHHWWHLTLRQAVWVCNCLEQSTTPPGMTPYQLLTRKKPDLTLARVWGCMVQFMVLNLTNNKVVTSVEVIFYETLSLEVWKAKLGPALGRTQAHPPMDTSMATVPLLVEVDEPADEDVVEVLPPSPVLAPPFPVADRPASTHVLASGNDGSLEASLVAPASGIAGGRQGAKLSIGELLKSAEALAVDEEGELSAGEEATDSDVVEVPITKRELRRIVKEAMASWKGEVVKAAMEEEIRRLIGMGTWELVERPREVNIMKNRWVLTTKYRIDDTVEREKARLVVKGFMQVCGADYDKTYSPVSSYVTLRIILSIVAVLDLNLMQLDMKNAFLQSKLDRVLYMYQLDYFDHGTGRVCKLLKSLYGLKQSPLLWYRALDGALLGAGWKKSQVDEALYFKAGDNGVICWVLVYIYDLLAASSSPAMLKELKELLEAAFDDGTGQVCKLLKSLYGLKKSPLLWYMALDGVLLGAGWKKSQVDEALYFKAGDNGVICWVLVYVDDLLTDSSSSVMLKELKELLEAAFELRKISPVVKRFIDEEQGGRDPKTLVSVDAYAELTFDDDEVQEREEEEHRQKVGLLQFAATTTRPDIAFACSKLGSGLTVRSDQHWREVDRCLAYLADTRDTALEFSGGPESLELIGYVDTDDTDDKQKRTSTSGYVFSTLRPRMLARRDADFISFLQNSSCSTLGSRPSFASTTNRQLRSLRAWG